MTSKLEEKHLLQQATIRRKYHLLLPGFPGFLLAIYEMNLVN
jgi:hypothetical protein